MVNIVLILEKDSLNFGIKYSLNRKLFIDIVLNVQDYTHIFCLPKFYVVE